MDKYYYKTKQYYCLKNLRSINKKGMPNLKSGIPFIIKFPLTN